MLSCAAPAAMPPAQHHGHWDSLLQRPVKEEAPEANESSSTFAKDQASGFYSEGFHSASPSGSSKDSNGHSPQSVGSNVEQGPSLYDSLPLHAKMNLGLHLEAYRNGSAYNMLNPTVFDSTRSLEARNGSPTYETRYSPHGIMRPNLESTPKATSNTTPPKSPDSNSDSRPYDRFHDSGFQQSMKMEQNQDADNADGSGHEDGEYEEEPGLRVPAVNSHGKVKTFKCKQCDFVAVTKLSFWEHSKEHIKPEKMLTCPKCPFVTEYKHHLEYHMRNHFGSKPFQCNQCSYSCVNKSMLNSHLKSHSNIYQYRCADCNYATKYCHSLKLHLRKYQHNPAMVLNHDGTPNPLPIIDVYGTRRGPKQKPLLKVLEETTRNVSPPRQPAHPLFPNPFPVNFPYAPLLSHPFLFPSNNNYSDKLPSLAEYQSEANSLHPSPASILHQRLTQEAPLTSPIDSLRSHSLSPHSPQISVVPPPSTPPAVQNLSTDDALDLTNSKHNTPRTPTPPAVPEQQESTTPTMKNRRKGRAFKLQPAALRMQHGERTETDEGSGSESDASVKEMSSDAYRCPYCDISFGDLTMHTIHMGFHGYNDPFMCNKCGERATDRVSFFIHLGRAQHA